MPSSNTYINKFDSWNKALEAAGLKINLMCEYGKAELIEALQTKARELGRAPKAKEVDADSKMPSATTYANKFGSWNKALEAAGLKVNKRHTRG